MREQEERLREQLAEIGNRSAELRLAAARFDAVADAWADRGRDAKRPQKDIHPDVLLESAAEVGSAAEDARRLSDRLETVVAGIRANRDERLHARESQRA
jgi:hypothetical protein